MRKTSKMTATIGGIPWTITFTPTWRDVTAGTDESGRHCGLTVFHDHSIRIAGDLPQAAQRRTLLHEIIHAVVECYQIRELIESDGHAEIPIDQLATGICEAMESIGIYLPHVTK